MPAEDALGQPQGSAAPIAPQGSCGQWGQAGCMTKPEPSLQPNLGSVLGSVLRGELLPASTAAPMTGTALGNTNAASLAVGWPAPLQTQVRPCLPSLIAMSSPPLAQLPPGRAQRVPSHAAGQATAPVPSQVCSWWHPSRPQGVCATGYSSWCHTPALGTAPALRSPLPRAGPQVAVGRDPQTQLFCDGWEMAPSV